MHEGLRITTSTKDDGNLSRAWGEEATVRENQEAFYHRAGVAAEDVVLMEPTHEDAVRRVGRDKAGTTVSAEALMTNEEGVVLALLTADCFPVAFYDPKHRAIALAHCGWRPVGLSLPKKVVEEMTAAFGTNPSELEVFIGPGIHPESYVVPHTEQEGEAGWQPYLRKDEAGVRVDMFSYLYDQLTAAGVPCSKIEIDPVDTAMAYEYFSHYRSVRTGEEEGRFMTLLGLV